MRRVRLRQDQSESREKAENKIDTLYKAYWEYGRMFAAALDRHSFMSTNSMIPSLKITSEGLFTGPVSTHMKFVQLYTLLDPEFQKSIDSQVGLIDFLNGPLAKERANDDAKISFLLSFSNNNMSEQ